MAEAWYPHASDYYVDVAEAGAYPVRQGDVFGAQADLTDWRGFLVLHPSCEIQTGKAKRVQVARLRAVSELADTFQQTAVTYGFTEDEGKVKVAFANTFWLPPATDSGELAEPMFADLRDVSTIPVATVLPETRVRALSHDARVHLIRRLVYFLFRWNLPLTQVRKLEASRISADAMFAGPRPSWG